MISESSSSGAGTTGDSQVDSKPTNDGNSTEDSKPTNDGKPNNAQTSSPQTGDGSSIILWVILFAISGTALTSMVLYKRKRVK